MLHGLTAELPPPAGAPPTLRWRVRLVDEPPVTGDDVLDLGTVPRTPVLAWTGGALRQVDGPVVRPGHAADRAGTLPDAAAAYERLARAAEAMAAAGGRLTGVDDGLLNVGYGRATAGRR